MFLYKNTTCSTFSGLRSVFYFSLKTKSSIVLRPLRAPLCSCWRGEWKHNGHALLPAAYARFCAASHAVWNGRKPGSTEALALKAPSSRDQWNLSCYNVLRLAGSALLWSTRCSADHALAQVRPRQIFICWSFWSQSRALHLLVWFHI